MKVKKGREIELLFSATINLEKKIRHLILGPNDLFRKKAKKNRVRRRKV